MSDYFDFSIYVDADEPDIEQWYVDRFLALPASVFQDPNSFFRFYAELSDDEADETARRIWRDINGLNLRENMRRRVTGRHSSCTRPPTTVSTTCSSCASD